jgi:hypothetical protein
MRFQALLLLTCLLTGLLCYCSMQLSSAMLAKVGSWFFYIVLGLLALLLVLLVSLWSYFMWSVLDAGTIS